MVSYKIDSEVKEFQEVVGEIMIVDDEPMVLSLVSEMIGVLGYKVVPFSCSVEAENYYVNNLDKITLVMLDMVMPKVSGAELYKRLDSKGGQTGFYILSGGSPEIESMKGGSFLGYIPKPVRLDEIDEKIKTGAQKVKAGLQ